MSRKIIFRLSVSGCVFQTVNHSQNQVQVLCFSAFALAFFITFGVEMFYKVTVLQFLISEILQPVEMFFFSKFLFEWLPNLAVLHCVCTENKETNCFHKSKFLLCLYRLPHWAMLRLCE